MKTMTGDQNIHNRGENKRWLKSGRSLIYSFVHFVNRTNRNVDIIWLNYEGARVKYRTLLPTQSVDANTFVGHPWIFCDAESGDRMVVQLKNVFEPTGWSPHDGWPPHRKTVNITLPVFTLKQRCLQEMRKRVSKSGLDELDIPKSLKEELQIMYHRLPIPVTS